jgi:hypothetical protein
MNMNTRIIRHAGLIPLLLCIVAVGAFSGGKSEQKPSGKSIAEPLQKLSLATGGTAGTYYPIGAAIANVITKYVDGVEVTAESTGASVANLKMIIDKKVDMILSAANTALGAYQGEAPFDKPIKNIRGITALYPETFQFVVLKASGLKSLSDLKGKKVVVGAPGSGTERTAKLLLEALGITYNDIKPQFISFAEGVTALKDRLVDCAIVGAGIPTSAVVDAATSLDITLLNVEQEAFQKVAKDSPYLMQVKIPAGTYRGLDKDVISVASPALLIVREDLSIDTVYKITAGIFGHLVEIQASHAQAKNISLENALQGMSVPLHPGAEKFYKEKGVIK